MSWKLMKSCILCISVVALMCTCCPEDPHKNYLNIIVNTEPKSLDPALSTDITTGILTALMYDNLVQFGVGSEIHPGLAESWEISPDGKTYRFVLRKDVKFWNGKKLIAEDVVYSFSRLLHPETASPQTWLLAPVQGADLYMQGNADKVTGIRAVSDHEVHIELISPFSPFLGFLGAPATAIVPLPDSISTRDLKNDPMGTGPWMYNEWHADRYIKLDRYEGYYNGSPKLEGIILNNIPEQLTAAIEFEAGNLDIMTIPSSEFKYWTRSEIWKPHIQKLEELGMYYLAMNAERPPFTDKRVRQAVTYALDREKIIHRILHNSATLAHGPVPPGLFGFDSSRTPLAYDPEKAKQLLIEAGYPDQCEFELWVDPGAAVSQTIEAIQHYLSQAGFKVHLVRNDWNMMRDAMRKGNTDAYWGNWWADYADPENFLAPLFHTDNASRRNRYSNTSVDSLIQRLQVSMDTKERIQLTRVIEDILIDEAPYAFMWYPISYTVSQPFLKDYVIHLMPNANKYTSVYFDHEEEEL